MQATIDPTIDPTMNLNADQPQRVSTRRVQPGMGGMRRVTTLEEDLEIARMIAKAMDSQFQIGPVKFGLDSIIGLIPGFGDLIGFAVGLYPVHIARKHKLGKLVIARMVGNLGLDFVGGLVPVAGDALDIVFKANLKNLKILESALAKRTLA